MNTSDVLNKAADLIEERGWSRGGGNGGWFPKPNTDTPVCVEGALRLAAGADGKADATATLGRYLLDMYPLAQRSVVHDGVMVFAWNDSMESPEPVIEALRACAVIEASREREAAEVSAHV